MKEYIHGTFAVPRHQAFKTCLRFREVLGEASLSAKDSVGVLSLKIKVTYQYPGKFQFCSVAHVRMRCCSPADLSEGSKVV